MSWWWVWSAFAAAPAGVDLDDIDGWTSAAELYRKGPAGCWEFEGSLHLMLKLDGGASALGLGEVTGGEVRGTVSGTLVNHEWTRFHYTLDQDYQPWMIIRPMWGSVAKGAIVAVDAEGKPLKPPEEQDGKRPRSFSFGGGGEGDGQSIRTSTVEYVDWDEEVGEVVFVQDVLMEGMGRGEAKAVHHFPGGQRLVTSVDITLPSTASFGRWPLQGTVQRASAHLRSHPVGGVAIPLAQRFSIIAGFFGQTVAADSQLSFSRARRCVVEGPVEEAAPEAMPEATQPVGEEI
jgi:hypothetical protein